jgi:hypothetical protein
MRLDLRPPRESSSEISQGGAALAPEPFPSSSHHWDLGRSDHASDNHIQRPALAIGDLNFRTMSQAEIFARRVHQEGLPVARLFQSKSALLSIGLNKKGKPGLWFSQQSH